MRKLPLLKFCILLSLLTGSCFSTYGQIGFSMGAKGGITFTAFHGDDAHGLKIRKGWVGGIFTNLSVWEFLSLQPEFLIHQKGATTNRYGNRNEIHINYFTVPILFKLRLPLEQKYYPHIFAGPALSYRIDGQYTSIQNGTQKDISLDNVRRSDTGGIIGAGVDVERKGIFYNLDIRYGFGFHSLGDNTFYLDLKNEDLTIMGGIGFRIGSFKTK